MFKYHDCKRKTSSTVMNCQFEFTVTQCSVAYGEKKLTVLWCLIISFPGSFPASLIIYWGSRSTFAIIGIAKIGLSFPREWGGHSNDKGGHQAPGGSHIDMVYVYVPAFWGSFSVVWFGFHQRQGNPNLSVFWANYCKKHPIWLKLGAILSKIVYWWVEN